MLADARCAPVDVCAGVGAKPAYPVGEVVARAHPNQCAGAIELLDGGVLDEFFEGLFGIEHHVVSVMHGATRGNAGVFVHQRGQTTALIF